MEKKRSFLLITLLFCFASLFFIPYFFLFGGMVMGEKITFVSMYNDYWYTIFDDVWSITNGGLLVLITFFGFGLVAFLLLLAFISYFVEIKVKKLSIATYILTGLTLVSVLALMTTLVLIATVQFLVEFAFFLVYTMSPYREDYYIHSYAFIRYIPLAFSINRCVRGGLFGFTLPLLLPVLLIPFVTYVLALVFIKGKKKPKEEPQSEEQSEEQPKLELVEEPAK